MAKQSFCLNKIESHNIKDTLYSLLGDFLPQVKDLTKEKRAYKAEETASKISSIINEINSLEINSRKVKAKDIDFGKINDLSGFVKSKDHNWYRKAAEQYLLDAKYVPQFLFAGGATRFGLGAMWGINLAVIGDVILGKKNDALKYISKKHLKAHIDRLKPLTYEELNLALRKLKKHRLKTKPVHIGMGPRQIIQYRLKLEKLAKRHNKDLHDVLSKACLIFNLNCDISDEVKNDLVKNDFYGFNPGNIFLLVQHTYKAHIIKNKGFVYDKKSDPLPLGHGHATMQMLYKSEAVQLDSHGKETIINNNVIDELLARGSKIIGTHRINDMTKWTDETIDIDKLAYGIYQINEKKKDVVVELVENPNNQKGGHWLKVKNKEFLCETLSTNTPELKEFIYSLEKVPYNAFRNMYSIQSLKQKLKGSCGIKLNLKYSDGGFYMESVTGDITLLMRSIAFQKKNEVIHDIKSIRDYVSEGIDFTARQENDPHFVKLAKHQTLVKSKR